ncbi:MAG: glycosyltransferase [Gemmataceae bacterium]|nr:glycosyltransferase [Gemmataceae bacterium]
MTEYLGFLHSSDEYKVMALASFGKPRYVAAFRGIVRVGDNGLYTIQPLRLEDRFGPARLKGGPLDQRHYGIAHSLQVVLEGTALGIARWLHGAAGLDDLWLAGGAALNCVMNARLRDRGPFRDIWVQPAAGDAGTAIGAALWVDAKERGTDERRYVMDHAYLGPEYTDAEIEEFLVWTKVPYRRLANVAEEVADILVQDRVIGWFQGRMEVGPRALGARSILASPTRAEMQGRLNEIKDREDFRPVAPVVMEEHAAEWFGARGPSPFMLFVFDVPADKADRIPAVRHTDGTARIQTVPRVSVVVPTYRRPELLARCRAALAAQRLPADQFEVIVVEDVLADGPATARNRGWRAARGTVIAFTDDDTIPDPAWLALTGRFAGRRLRGNSLRPSHVAEMVVTSALVPPLSVFWRLAGASGFRVRFV